MNLELLLNAISIANPLIQRNETVIKLLKQFHLDPEHPPEDFSGVYAYALVEYGVGKPKPLLKLFQQEEIKKAFRQAFDHNNPSILLSEVDAFIDGYALGDDIKSLRIDIKREIAEFYIVFSEVAKRTRRPADTLISQEIGSLHLHIASIQEQLDRLPTLEAMRTEIARLEAGGEKGRGGTLEGNTRPLLFALAQQMRGWFETLGYRFEKYEVWAENYFEWIINVPVRRNRYDRILVRGIEGEVGLSDAIALRQSQEAQRTDEGWLVTERRISPAARAEVSKEENKHLGCYTFDELLAQDADFTDYLDWLEAEVKRRKIDTRYVPLACTKEEIDFVTKRQVAVSCYHEQEGWIDGYVDRWLDDPVKEHISILGEFGTGKTWFALHYAWVALQRYRDAQKRGVQLPRLPLVIPLRDYAKAVSVESLFSEFFFRQYKIPLPHYDAFVQLNRMGKLLLIFDGFDEMAARVDKQQMINNFWELAKVVVPGAKVILTCRTEHFPEAQEGRALLNAQLQASTANLTGETPQFEVLELEKFNDEQIQQVLSYQGSASTVEQVMNNPQLLDLARRPVMTELILEALPDIAAGKPVDMSRVYLYAVRRKMDNDIKSDRTFTSLADKLYFLCELSWEMLSTDQMSLNYRLFPDRIRRLFAANVQQEKDLDHWHYDMMGQTMLIRNADGDYTPAHRSLLEFFVAYKFAAELGALASDFTEMAQAQSNVDKNAAPQDYTWSDYFSSHPECSVGILRGFISESLEKLRETFGRSALTKAVMDLLLPMLDDNQPLINIIEATRGKSENEVRYVGGNAATLVVKLDKVGLEGRDLSRTVIKGADFSGASLRGVNFVEASLSESDFTKVFGRALSVAFTPDGKFFAIGEGSGSIRLFKVVSGKQILNLQGHSDLVRSIVISSDGKTIISGSHDRTIKIWDLPTGKCLNTLQGHSNRVYSVAISSNNLILASGSSDGTVKIWNLHTGKCLKTLEAYTRVVYGVAISSDNQTLATGCWERTIKLWNIETGECLKTLHGHTDKVLDVAFNSDGTNLISSGDTVVRLWDVNSGVCQETFCGHTDGIESVAFSPDDKIIVSCGYDQTIKLWDVTGKCIQTLKGHTDAVWSAAFSPDGNTLVTISSDSTIKLWDTATGECFKTLNGHSSIVYDLDLCTNNKFLVTSGDDGLIRIWDINTGQYLKTLQERRERVWSVVFSLDSRLLISGGGGDDSVKIWDVHTGKCLKAMYGSVSPIYSVAISSDSTIIASSNGNGIVQLWNVSNGECVQTLQCHNARVYSVAFNSDNTIIASGSDDQTIKLWDIYTGECIKVLQEHNGSVNEVLFSADSKTLFSCGDDGIKIWNIQTGKCIKTLHGHTHRIISLDIVNDSLLASSSCDKTIRLWNIHTGECLKVLHGHTNSVWSVAISSDARIVVSGSLDETIKIWDVNTGECLRTLDNKPYASMNITGVKGLTAVDISTLNALGAIEEVK
jgi:predicted NACHT family NTPase